MRRLVLVSSISAVLAASAAHATVLWRGDFSSGDLSQWNDAQSASPEGRGSSPSRLLVVNAPDAPNGRALRVRLESGDVAYNVRHTPPYPMGNRSELVHVPNVHEGDERWYRFRVLFPHDFSVNDGKGGGAVFLQWHHIASDGSEPGSPPLLFTALTDELRVVQVPALNSQDAITLGKTKQKKDQWRDIVIHARFSGDPNKGLLQTWVDGDKIVDRHVSTLFPGYEAYLKMGLYRRPSVKETNVVYFSGMVEATSREDLFTDRHASR